jgi:DNA repair photolyase
MRWSNLTASPADARGEGAGADALPLALPDAVVRTFDTPGFAGMTFYEVRAKSLINKVPGASRVPFEWTINPYRGCSHACTYCLSGDTPVLMADGSTKPLAELAVGDRIVGTRRHGAHRRYVPTGVLAHWSTVRPAYRVVLADGTELISSGDHRFLTGSGWKHVTTQRCGHGRRPHLTTDDTLLGTSADPRVKAIERLGFEMPMYDITTGTGDFIANGVVSHNCFARNTHTYLDLDAGEDFDRKVIVKVNAGELVRKELAAPRWRGDHIAMGTNVDCYQRAEGRYGLMREILAALRDFANPFSILTKGTLILRDLDLLRQAAEVTDVGLAVSVGFVDEALWRSVEPGTPSPQRRLGVVRQLTDAGFAVGVLMAPVLPGLTDDDASIEAAVAAIADAGAATVTPLPLHLRPGAREWYGQWLAREHPELVPRYRELFARGSYSPKDYQREVTARVRRAARRHGLGGGGDGSDHRTPASPEEARATGNRPRRGARPPAPDQPTLW